MAEKMHQTRENVGKIDDVTSMTVNEQSYEPFLNRPDGPKTSDLDALFHIMKITMGTGILFLPDTFRKTGYVMSIICGLLIGLIYTHNSIVLVQCAQTLCRYHRLPKLDFAETVEVSFLTGPMRTRRYGKAFGIYTNIVICFIHYKEVVVYILYVASSFQQMIEYITKTILDVRVYVMIFYPIYSSLILAPNLKYLMPFSMLGTILFFVGFTTCMIYLVDDIPNPKRLDRFTNVQSIPMCVTIFFYALHNITILLPLENTMRKPNNLPRLIIVSSLFNTLIYVGFGFLGYNKYKDTCDVVTKNLPLDEVLSEFVKIGISLSILFTIAINYIIPVTIIWPVIMSINGVEGRHETIFRLAGITIITIIAIAVPQMVPLTGLLSALGMTSTILLIPMLVEINTKWQEATYILYIKSVLIFILFLLVLIFGTMESLRTIIMEYNGTRQPGC